MKNLTKILVSMCVAIMMIAVACKKDDPTPTTPVTPTTTPPVVTKSSAKAITKFSFAALSPVLDATIDETNKAITATVPAATDVTKLVPTITLSDKATISPATGVAQDFSKEVSYTVTAEDASTVVYKVNVIVIKACKLTSRSGPGFSYTYEYDSRDRFVKLTFKNTGSSYTTLVSYDADGFVTQQTTTNSYTDPTFTYGVKSNITLYSYSNGKLTKITSTDTNFNGTTGTGISSFEYDNQGNLAKYIYPDGNETTWNAGQIIGYTRKGYTLTKNSNGLITKETSPYDYITYEYDTYNQPISVKNYDSKGVLSFSTAFQYTKSNVSNETNPFSFKGHPTNYNIKEIKLYSLASYGYTDSYIALVNTYDYDTKGKISSVKYKDNKNVSFDEVYIYKDCN